MKKNTQILLAAFLLICGLIIGFVVWNKQQSWSEDVASSGSGSSLADIDAVVNPGESMNVVSASGTQDIAQDKLVIIRGGDASKCGALRDADQAECKNAIAYNRAVDLLEYGDCDTISDETMRTNCRDKISRGLYLTAWVLADCSGIQNEDIKLTCINRFSAIADMEEGLVSCATIKNKEESLRCADDYYLVLARSGKMQSNAECDKINSPIWKRECQLYVRRNSVSWSASRESVGEAAQAECSGNGYCMKTKIVAAMTGEESGSTASCSYISDAVMRQSCVNEITSKITKSIFDKALSQKDPSICNQIADAAAIARCQQIVGR